MADRKEAKSMDDDVQGVATMKDVETFVPLREPPVARPLDRKRKTTISAEEIKRISDEDKAFIDAGADEADRANRRALVTMVETLNGDTADVTPGTSMTYIPEESYYQRAVVSNAPPAIAQLIENALNWVALGRNKAAVYGAAVRWNLRDQFVDARESKVHTVDFARADEKVKAAIAGYSAALRPVIKQAAFWGANCNNVAALSGALMISAGHHYDSANTRPQAALVGALGQAEDVDSEAYRALFYLSVHPLPLEVIERKRKQAAEGKFTGYSEAVRIRCNGVPSGYGALAIAAAALEGMVGEPYYRRLVTKYALQVNSMRQALATIKENPSVYHINATDYGVERKFIDLSSLKEIMVIGIAYARFIIKGTMQKAASGKKFYDQNKKAVETWGKAFEQAAEEGIVSLNSLLA